MAQILWEIYALTHEEEIEATQEQICQFVSDKTGYSLETVKQVFEVAIASPSIVSAAKKGITYVGKKVLKKATHEIGLSKNTPPSKETFSLKAPAPETLIDIALKPTPESSSVRNLISRFEVKTTETVSSAKGKPSSKENPLIGEYKDVKGHHVHAKKAFEGHINYDPKKGFAISNEYMEQLGIKHQKITSAQQKMFIELSKSGRPNTLKEHTRIAVESLVEAGVKKEKAREIVTQSLKELKKQGIKKPTNIPWGDNK